MRFHFDTSLTRGGALTPSVFRCGAIRTGLDLFVVASMSDWNHVSALAPRGMR